VKQHAIDRYFDKHLRSEAGLVGISNDVPSVDMAAADMDAYVSARKAEGR